MSPPVSIGADATLVLRFAADAACAAGLAPPNAARARLQSETYFDTAGFTLAGRDVRLSRRKRRGGWEMVLRWAADEIVVPLADDALAPEALPPEAAEALAALLGEDTLAPVLVLDTRTITHTTAPGVELRLISGTLTAGGAKQKFHDVELAGTDPSVLYPAALELCAAAPLRLAVQCPAARGLVLAGGPPPAVARTGAGLSGAPSLDDAIAALIGSCLTQFTANLPPFAHGDAVNAVHQMRVALRRLRSLLGLFNRALPCADFAAFRAEAKRLASAMGEARNWDVFMALVQNGPAAAFPDEPGFMPLLEECARHRAAGYDDVRDLLNDPATTHFVLGLRGFVARRGWRNVASPEALLALTAPATSFAATSLARLHRKVRKRGRHLRRLPLEQKHLVRIEMKKLRYTVEPFAGVLGPREKMRTYAQTTAKLQDQLGVLNDLATALHLLGRLETSHPGTARAAGIVMGWCARGASTDDTALGKSWDDFRGLKPPTG